MSRRIEELLDVLRIVREDFRGGTDRGESIPRLRISAVRSVAKRDGILYSTVSDKYRRQLKKSGIPNTPTFDMQLEAWLVRGSSQLRKAFLRHSVDSEDDRLISEFFDSRHIDATPEVREVQAGYGEHIARQIDPVERKRIEEAAIGIAIQYEVDQRREPVRVDAEKLGYDLESMSPGQTRLIEVKGLSGTGPIEMTPNEVRVAQTFGNQYYLYVVEHALGRDARLNVIRNPAAKCSFVPSGWLVSWRADGERGRA